MTTGFWKDSGFSRTMSVSASWLGRVQVHIDLKRPYGNRWDIPRSPQRSGCLGSTNTELCLWVWGVHIGVARTLPKMWGIPLSHQWSGCECLCRSFFSCLWRFATSFVMTWDCAQTMSTSPLGVSPNRQQNQQTLEPTSQGKPLMSES
jgi:hypothetical protein